MTYMTDSIDWIENMEEEMREYEEIRRLIKKAKETAEVSYIMENLHSKPLNELRRCIGMKEVEPTRIPSADWIREKLGVSEGFAKRMENYCDPDSVNKTIKDYYKKNGLSEDVPLFNEIRDVLESNGSIINEILDSLREGKLNVTYLRVYKVDENMLGLSLLRLYSSIDAMNTYENEFVGYFKLDEAVDIIVDFFKAKKISKLLLEKEISKVVHRAVIFKGIEMMEEEGEKLAAREAIIDMAKGLGKVEGKDGNYA